jgi:outer membrane protein OmpA-like peptidoglycan-associated protein
VSHEHDDLTGEATSPWPAFADLLAASTLLFLILFAAVAIPAIRAAGKGRALENRIQWMDSTLKAQAAKHKGVEVERVGDYLRITIPEQATFLQNRAALADLQPMGRSLLRALGDSIRNNDRLSRAIDQIQVVGHTSSEGGNEKNWRLSSERATTVALFLIDSLKLSPCMVTALGRGRYYPVSPDSARATTAYFERDRRIELEVRPVVVGDSAQQRRRAGCVEEPGRDVADVRALYTSLNGAIAGGLTAAHRDCRDGSSMAVYRMPKGQGSKYEQTRSFGTLDARAHYYLGANGRMRFAFLTRRVSGVLPEETRVYFDANGRLLSRNFRPAPSPLPDGGFALTDSLSVGRLPAC